MIGNLSKEERAELDAQCDIWQAEAIDAQEFTLMEDNPENKVVSR